MKKIYSKLAAGVLALSVLAPASSFAADLEKQHGNKAHFVKLNDETKQKLQEIRDQVKAGELTEEQAKTQLKELGIKPHFGKRRQHSKLDAATKEKLDDIKQQVKERGLSKEEAKLRFQELWSQQGESIQ